MKTFYVYIALIVFFFIFIIIYACQKTNLEFASKDLLLQSEVRDSKSYYGNNVKIEIAQNLDGHLTVYRSNTGNTHYEPVVINATDKSVVNGELIFDNDASYYFIPFDMGESARSISGSGATCVSKDCTGDCSLEASPGGCLRCQCSLSGDCDLSVGGTFSAGVIIEARNLTLVNL